MGGSGAGQRQLQGGHPLSPGRTCPRCLPGGRARESAFQPGTSRKWWPPGFPPSGRLGPCHHPLWPHWLVPTRAGRWLVHARGLGFPDLAAPPPPQTLSFLGVSARVGLGSNGVTAEMRLLLASGGSVQGHLLGGGAGWVPVLCEGNQAASLRRGRPPHAGFLSRPGSGDPPPLLPALFPVLCTGLLAVHTQVTAGHLPGGTCQSVALVAPDP